MENISFSGEDEDFAAFSEQFEPRMLMLNLWKCLEDKLTVPAYKEEETRGEETARAKAEVHALSEAVREALHLQGTLECIGEKKQTTILSDSQLCLALVSKDDGSYKAKHFATRQAFLRDTVKCREHGIDLKFVSSADNMADLFTEGLGRLKTIQHTMGL